MPVIIGGVPRRLYERTKPPWRTPLVIFAVTVFLTALAVVGRPLVVVTVVACVFLAMGGLVWSFAVMAFRVLRVLFAVVVSRLN